MKLKDYFKKAKSQKWAIGQFNFSTLEQLRGIFLAAKSLKAPVILGTSEGESKFLGIKEIIALVEILKMEYQVPAFLNLDHGKNEEWIKAAVDYGYDSVHFDGSGLSFEENVKQTKKIADYAHKKGIMVEGELGLIKGDSKLNKGAAEISEKELTLPSEVAEFVKRTKVDSLAVAIGNVHGVYKDMPKLDLERLGEINRISKAFLVLHGGSGISDSEVKKSVGLGIVKANFNTELRVAWRNSLVNCLKDKNESKPYKILPVVQEAVRKKVEEKMTLLGQVDRL